MIEKCISTCITNFCMMTFNNETVLLLIPGQLHSEQTRVCDPFPWHVLPPFSGKGAEHDLLRD